MVGLYFDGSDQYRRYGVHDDGSCFFHTICAAKNIGGYRDKGAEERKRIGRQFRNKIRSRISKQNWNAIWSRRGVTKEGQRVPEVETIRDMLGNHTTWADVYIILYVMDKMNLNMIFFDMHANGIYCGVRGLQSDKQDSVLVAWVNRAHFEPIFRAAGEEDLAKGDVDLFLYPPNDPFICALMDRYHSELCVYNNDIGDIL
jgi:hypothetical protein